MQILKKKAELEKKNAAQVTFILHALHIVVPRAWPYGRDVSFLHYKLKFSSKNLLNLDF